MLRIAGWIGCLVLCTLVLTTGTGCARCGETIAEKAMEKVAEQVTGADEVSIGGKGTPVDISDLPPFLKYPNAKALHKVKVSDEETRGGHYGFETGDGVDLTAGWYERTLSGQGWKQVVKAEMDAMIQLHYQSPDEKDNVSLAIHPEDGKTKIALHYIQKVGN